MSPSLEALELARRLAALPEHRMREVALVEHLGRADPALTVKVLADIHDHGRREGPPFNIALLTLVTVLSEQQLDYALQARLYAEAKEAGLASLRDLFFTSQLVPETPARPSPPRELTLGHRKWMARSSRREVLARLIRDPEEEVVPILLKNPHLIEGDVVQLAAMRPTSPEVQWVIFQSPRWIARYAVKRTLVLNPFTPTEISVRLLAFLNETDLRLVLTSPGLPTAVHDAARRRTSRAE